jgi:hypothetical protein
VKYYKAEGGQPVAVWLNEEKPEPFPQEFGTLAEASDNGTSEIIAPDGHRYTVGKGAAVMWENGALRVLPGRAFNMSYKETDEKPPESLQEEFQRRVLSMQNRQHPGVVAAGNEGQARQGPKTSGPGQAGRDMESASRSGPMPSEANFGSDPSGSVPGANFVLGGENTGGSPHAMAYPAAQPELVQRGTDAKVEDPRRPAADIPRVSPGSGPEATASVLAPKQAAEEKQEEAAAEDKPEPQGQAQKGQKPEDKPESDGADPKASGKPVRK